MWHLRLVQGESMLPSYRPGQTIIVSHARHFKVGDVVIAFMGGKEVMKRVTEIDNGQVFLEGDNREQSKDSRHHGWLVDRHVVGKVIWPVKDKRDT